MEYRLALSGCLLDRVRTASGGFAVAAFEQQDRGRDTEQDQHAYERDCRSCADRLRIHQRDEDTDSCENSEGPHAEQCAPEELVLWMRNRFTHHQWGCSFSEVRMIGRILAAGQRIWGKLALDRARIRFPSKFRVVQSESAVYRPHRQ